MMELSKPKLPTKFEVASLSRCRNITGDYKILGSFPSPWPRPFSSALDFMMGIGKPQRLAKFEVAGFICYENIREFVFKNSDEPKWGNPLLRG